MKTAEEKLFRLSISRWGKNLQRIMVMEECAELTQAVAKDIRDGEFDRNNQKVCEELADVGIMLDQMKLMYNEEIIKTWRINKLKRLEERLI